MREKDFCLSPSCTEYVIIFTFFLILFRNKLQWKSSYRSKIKQKLLTHSQSIQFGNDQKRISVRTRHNNSGHVSERAGKKYNSRRTAVRETSASWHNLVGLIESPSATSRTSRHCGIEGFKWVHNWGPIVSKGDR